MFPRSVFAARYGGITGARCGGLIAWAKPLGHNDRVKLLQRTLDEERATDKQLTTLAESKVNLRAAN